MIKSNAIAMLVLVTALCACGGDDDGVGDPHACGDATCSDGQVCCDHCAGSCVPENSGAFCPDDEDPNRDCSDGGIEEGRGDPFSDGRAAPVLKACVRQPEIRRTREPVGLHCGSSRPEECDQDDPCPCVVEEAECTPDPDELGLCQCDNGTV